MHSHMCSQMAKVSCLHISPTVLQADKALQTPCSSNSSSPQRHKGLAAHTWSSYQFFIFLVKNQKFESHVKTLPWIIPTLTQGRVAQGATEESPRQPHSLCPLTNATSDLSPVYQHEESRMFHRRRGKSPCDGKNL